MRDAVHTNGHRRYYIKQNNVRSIKKAYRYEETTERAFGGESMNVKEDQHWHAETERREGYNGETAFLAEPA